VLRSRNEQIALVQIFVPTFDEDGSDGGGKIGSIGTGYPVAPEVILTARHVIEPENRDENYAIGIRGIAFPRLALPTDISTWRPMTSSGRAKVPLMPHCCAAGARARPNRISGFCRPRRRVRVPSGSAKAFRAPRSAMSGGEHAGFAGKMHSMATEWQYFEVGVRESPSEEEGWRGASGMPIFGPGNKIFGVAVKLLLIQEQKIARRSCIQTFELRQIQNSHWDR